MKENLINTSTTGSNPLFFLGVGLSSILPSSTSAEPIHSELSSDDLSAIECRFNPPMKFSTDEYIETTYKAEFKELPIYESIDFAFMGLTQKFASEQVVLNDDFTEALDELFESKINNKPKKTRF
jgi:hypothetical protein